RKSNLHGAKLSGHSDHRVVMALSVAGMNASGQTEVATAEAVKVTFPPYFDLMNGLGAKMEILQ
ncbi:MAG: 3-phosphoshikimate 1-carboxyvinyltransferase, partial [archaeon]|nr:3-phosphoshikimate 1-carboxyvinyltransferase [archaeon]